MSYLLFCQRDTTRVAAMAVIVFPPVIEVKQQIKYCLQTLVACFVLTRAMYSYELNVQDRKRERR
jgi:hypothetical protein